MIIKTILKNGYVIETECEEMSVTKNKLYQTIEKIEWKGCKRGKPTFVRVEEIIAIVREDFETQESNKDDKERELNDED